MPELGISTAAVSRRVERLEQQLALPLLVRSTCGVTPTVEAESPLASTAPLFAAFDEAVEEALGRDRGLVGDLRVTAHRTATDNFVGPWLADFARAHQRLGVEIIASDQWINMADGLIDLAVRVGPIPDSSLTATRLCAVCYALDAPRRLRRRTLSVLGDEGWMGLSDLPAVVALPLT